MFCFNCKQEQPGVKILRNGSMVTGEQICNHCGADRTFTRRSQPFVFGKFPAANLMMPFGIVTSGVNISQAFIPFCLMGLCAISPRPILIVKRGSCSHLYLGIGRSTKQECMKLQKVLDNCSGLVMVNLILWDTIPSMGCTHFFVILYKSFCICELF